MLFQFDQIDHL